MSVQYSLYSDLEHYRNSPPVPVLVKEVSFNGKVRLKANSDSSPPVSRKKAAKAGDLQQINYIRRIRVLQAISTKYAKIYVLHRAALLILLILPLANKGFLWYALSTERVSPMKS